MSALFYYGYLDKKHLTQYKSICLKGLDLEEISTIAFILPIWRDNNNCLYTNVSHKLKKNINDRIYKY